MKKACEYSPLERGEGCVLKLKQLIDEAKNYAFGYTTSFALKYYHTALIRTINHSTNRSIVDKAKLKAPQVRMLLGIYNERKN